VASTPDNFLGLDGRRAAYQTAAFAVLPIPYEASTSFGAGTRQGPRAIISASQQVELYDEELRRDSSAVGVATLAPLESDARGPQYMVERVAQMARRVVRDGKFLIGLGGEHTVTVGLVQGVLARYRRLSVLQIDAHADLRDRYQGSPFSHACVMRRIRELGLPVVAVGIRNYSAEEARFIRRSGQCVISARDVRQTPDWIERAVEALGEQVYVSIDIDGFDPACAPGTGTPEPGGLDWYQVAGLLAEVARRRRIVAADVVEVVPLPGNVVTEFLAAKLIYRLIGLVSVRRGRV